MKLFSFAVSGCRRGERVADAGGWPHRRDAIGLDCLQHVRWRADGRAQRPVHGHHAHRPPQPFLQVSCSEHGALATHTHASCILF